MSDNQEDRLDIDEFIKELKEQYQELPGKEEEDQALNEPSPEYKKSYTLADRPIPDYVLEDFRIGMEQFRRGEYIDMEDFIKSLNERCSD